MTKFPSYSYTSRLKQPWNSSGSKKCLFHIAGQKNVTTAIDCHPGTSIHEELDGTIDIVVALELGHPISNPWLLDDPRDRWNRWRFRLDSKPEIPYRPYQSLGYFNSSGFPSTIHYPNKYLSISSCLLPMVPME